MIVYCAHRYEGDLNNLVIAGKKIHDLQAADSENTYYSPLHAFSYMKYDELDIEHCLDMLTLCDKVMVLSDVSAGVKKEIELAEKLGLEVIYCADI